MPFHAGPATGAGPVAAGSLVTAPGAGFAAARPGRGRYPCVRWYSTNSAWWETVAAEGFSCAHAVTATAPEPSASATAPNPATNRPRTERPFGRREPGGPGAAGTAPGPPSVRRWLAGRPADRERQGYVRPSMRRYGIGTSRSATRVPTRGAAGC